MDVRFSKSCLGDRSNAASVHGCSEASGLTRVQPWTTPNNYSQLQDSTTVDAIESSTAQISGHDRSQLLPLPEAIDDYGGADHPVRFVDAFVDGLDLAAAGFARDEPKATGRTGYAPADLLKLYIQVGSGR
jgi:hypothetical protein